MNRYIVILENTFTSDKDIHYSTFGELGDDLEEIIENKFNIDLDIDFDYYNNEPEFVKGYMGFNDIWIEYEGAEYKIIIVYINE